MRVVNARHRPDFDEEYETMNKVWSKARQVSETEADYIMEHGKGWGR